VERLALARWDQLRVGVRDRFLLLAAKAIGVAAGLALSIAGAVYVMHGAALGLASACGSLWLGYVLAGLLFVVGSVLSVLTVRWYLRVRALRRMERKYAARDSVVPSGSNGRPRARARAGVSRARGE
jgi:membrane protein implicated in regulation of membrane protease activity